MHTASGHRLLAPLACAIAVATIPPAPPPTAPSPLTFDDLTTAVANVLGPTTDLLGELAWVLPAPIGVATPPDAFVTTFAFDIEGDSYNAYIDATTSLGAADAEATLLTAVTAAGLAPTGEEVPGNFNGMPVRTVWFAEPAGHQVGLTVVAGTPVWYELNLAGPATADRVLAFSASWGDLPLPPEATITRARVSPTFDGTSLEVTTTFELPGDASTAESGFIAALGTGGWTVDPAAAPTEHVIAVRKGDVAVTLTFTPTDLAMITIDVARLIPVAAPAS